MNDDDDDCDWYGGSAKRSPARTFHLARADVTLTIAQDSLLPNDELWAKGAGAVVWEAAAATLEYLDAAFAPDGLRGKTVVELGAGTGVCGLACAALGALVVLTDLPEALPLLRKNAAASPWSSSIEVRELQWGDCTALAGVRADLVLACDCQYQRGAYDVLAATIAELRSPCVLSWVPRGKDEEALLALLAGFEIVAVSRPDQAVFIKRATPPPADLTVHSTAVTLSGVASTLTLALTLALTSPVPPRPYTWAATALTLTQVRPGPPTRGPRSSTRRAARFSRTT